MQAETKGNEPASGRSAGSMVPEAEMTCIVQILILMWCFLIEEIFERIVFLTN